MFHSLVEQFNTNSFAHTLGHLKLTCQCRFRVMKNDPPTCIPFLGRLVKSERMKQLGVAIHHVIVGEAYKISI